MRPFTPLDGLVVPLDRANVDTDAIIPKQFLKSIKRSGFGPNLFDEWRYLDRGEPGQDCSNRPRNADFSLTFARAGSGTSQFAERGCASQKVDEAIRAATNHRTKTAAARTVCW